VINLAIGLWIVQDYGLSTDEPNYYRYADYTLEAYKSFFGLLYEPVYGFSDLYYYGPAFILIVNSIIKILHWLPVDFWDVGVWHYAYFVTFQLTGLCLYGLAKRWFNYWTAWAVLVIFITQPLLWGHAFINPKDIPFMFFFAFSVWTGYQLVDSLGTEPSSFSVKGIINRFKSIESHKKRILLSWLLLTGVGFALSRSLVYFIIDRVVRIFYYAEPGTWAANVMRSITEELSRTPVENYVTKAQTIYSRFDIIVFTLSFTAIGVYLITLLTITSFDFQGKRFWQRFSLKISEGIQISDYLSLSQIGLQKILEFIRQTTKALRNPKVILAGIVLGLTTSVRVLGPLAGLIVVLYLLIQIRGKSFPIILAYFVWAGLIMYLTWPFLWQAPIAHLYETLNIMSKFPLPVTALFNGKYYFTDKLPITYLPVLISLQLTDTLVIFSYLGFGFFILQLLFKGVRVDFLLYIGLGFFVPILGLIILHSPLYDNFRQLLFLIPPIFFMGAFMLEFVINKIKKYWLRCAFIILFITPALISIVRLHPYQYIYYNSFIGGVKGAFRSFEMDYWYTSLSELSSWVNENAKENATVIVKVAPPIVAYQLRSDLSVKKIGRPPFDENADYDYAILTTRWNTDRYYPNAEIISIVERDGAVLGVLKDIKGEKSE
jgi:hypothetical protein